MKDETLGEARPSLTADRLGAVAVLGLFAFAVHYGWTHFPVPADGGLLVLGVAGLLATAAFFGKARAGQPLLGRSIAFAATVLLVQAAMQGAVAAGWLSG